MRQTLSLLFVVTIAGCATGEKLGDDDEGRTIATGATAGATGSTTGGSGGGGSGGSGGSTTGGGTGGSGGTGATGGAVSGGTGGVATAGTTSAAGAGTETGGAAGSPGTGGTSGGAAGAGTGGIGAAGSGGTGGVVGTGGSAGAPAFVGLSVRYVVEATDASTTAIGSQLFIYNDGSDTIGLSELTLRYYLTNEVTAALLSRINWANVAPVSGGAATQIQAEVTISVAAMPSPVSGADSYVELGFTGAAGSLAPGDRVQLSWTVQNHTAEHFNQTDDYSFDAAVTSETEWDRVVLLRGGSAVWGLVP